ncbi:MAG: hypothetical protein IKP40_01155 [Clostridia bacterium]|nr:hypothetical protein [Clostridia bacterium]
MKRIICLLTVLCLLLTAGAAAADVYVNKPKPADWEERELLKLTCLGTVLNDALLLEVGGKTMLIDGGTGKWADKVQAAINERGLDNHVDVFYNSHPHDDHTEATIRMIHKGLTMDETISTFPPEYKAEWQVKLMTALEEAGIPYRQLEYGEQMDFGGAHLQFWYDPTGRDPNAQSSICHIRWKNATVLLTGDMTGAASHHFIDNFTSEQLHADILKVPHHGLMIMVEDFLKMVDPEFAFVTSRMSTTEKVMNQLKRHKIQYLYNSTGSIFMETDGEDWYITMTKGVF